MTPSQNSSQVHRSWPFFSTPPAVFAGVMGPLTVMMLTLASLSGMPDWIRISAAVIVAISLGALWRGYLCRIEATPSHVRYRTPLRRWAMSWSEIRGIDAYIPLDRNLRTRYVYITRSDEPPTDRREIGPDTFQLQERPGLVEALRECRRRAISTSSPAPTDDPRAAAPSPPADRRGECISAAHLTHGDPHS